MNMSAVGLEETQQCIGDFHDTMSDVLGSIQRYEDRLATHHALGAAAKDRRHLPKIKVCTSAVTITICSHTHAIAEACDKYTSNVLAVSCHLQLLSTISSSTVDASICTDLQIIEHWTYFWLISCPVSIIQSLSASLSDLNVHFRR